MEKKTTVADKTARLETLEDTEEALRVPAIRPPVTYPLETLVPEVRHQTPGCTDSARPDTSTI
ncbi:MAG: hypothetical protein HY701_05930 [Gemmatimonadetes bacterium]|nr:hypothetical protein [Gemmatimonadota bacterium]